MSIFDSLFSAFRGQKNTLRPSQPIAAPDSEDEPPEQTILRTLVIVYEPTIDSATGTKLSQFMRWNSVEELAKGYMSDVLQASNGLVRYQITQRIDVDAFPSKVNGYVYDAQTYVDVMRGHQRPYMPQEANYY